MFKVYDNGGRTADRYTIYFYDYYDDVWQPNGCITTDGHPNNPQGIWLRGDFVHEAVGKDESKISVVELPEAAKNQLLKELEMGNE